MFKSNFVVTLSNMFKVESVSLLKPCLYNLCIHSIRSLTVEKALSEWSKKFEDAKIPESDISIKNILVHILELSKIGDLLLKNDVELNKTQYEKLQTLCECRLARMPVQYIIKEWEFRDLRLKMSPPVFIPRPETEILIDIVQDNCNHPKHILEVGCGSGAISIALLKHFKQLKMIAVDQSGNACNLTKENANMHGVLERLDIIHAKLSDKGVFLPPETSVKVLGKKFDVIVSNPPYVPSAEVLTVEPEIYLYEDLRALDGGKDGLKIIKSLLSFASNALNENGTVFLEVHYLHSKLISDWISGNPQLNLSFKKTYKDFCQKDRFVQISKVS